MLLPKELDALPDRVTELYATLEEDIIKDMARRIVKTDFATETAQWQLIQLQRMSITRDEVFDRLSKATGKTKDELVDLFNAAAEKSFAREDRAYRKAGYKTVPLAENAQLQKIINAGLRKTENLFDNLTSTTANTASRQFENALDAAYMQITSGAFDYNTAIRTCIRDLAQKGIAYITYPSGHTDYLDVAVRRAALTGVGQTCGEMQIALADEMDCDLVEVTAHNGARPEHAVWQGKVYSRSGKSTKYPDFVKSTGYGTGAGLKGWNCRHDFFPFFEDSEPAYTQKELAEFENRQVTYNGEKMTEYEATQKQRAMERRIRATKRELAGYDAGIGAATDDSLKSELQTAFNKKSILLKRKEAVLKDFTKQTGLTRDRSREQVSAHFDSKQGKTVAFNKSVSQKAVSVVQRNQKFIENMEAIGIHTEGFDRFAGKTEVLNEMQSAYSKIAEIYPEELKGLTIRYAFDKDASVYGWYDNTINEIAFNRNIFDHYDKLVKEYAECVQSGHFSPNTDYRSCFYHEFGHLYSNFHNIDNKSIVEELTKEYWGGHYTRKKANEMLSISLSDYSTEATRPQYQEVIAECFSEWYNSKNPRKFCENYLRKVGVIK